MSRMRMAACLVVLALGCSKTPRKAPQESPAARVPEADGWGADGAPRFGGVLAEWRAVPAPGAGRFAMRAHISTWRLITREHTSSSSGRSSITLRLDADGVAAACFGHAIESSSRRRVYQAGGHTDHSGESNRSGDDGYRGRWQRRGPWLEVTFTQRGPGCPVDAPAGAEDGGALARAPRLTCAGLAPPPGDAGARTALACRIEGVRPDEGYGFALAGGQTSWVILGDPGVDIDWRERRAISCRVAPGAAVADDDWSR